MTRVCLASIVAGCLATAGLFALAKGDVAHASTEAVPAGREKTSFSVISMTPQGELPSAVAYPAIQVQFSEPVVALKALGEPMKTSDVLTIEPKLNGVFRWRGTSLLSFDAADEAIPQKIYTVKINPKLTSAKGTVISGELTYTFHTEELKLTGVTAGYGEVQAGKSVDQNSVPPELAKDIAVFFNAPVNASVVKTSLSVRDESGKSYEFGAKQAEKNSVRLTLTETPREDTVITVTLKKGAMADTDCYAVTQETSRRFHTLVAFRVTDCMANARYYDSEVTNPVRLTFSAPLRQDAEAALARFVRTDLAYTVTEKNLRVQGKTLVVHGLPVTYEEKYRLYIDAGFFDVYGRTLSKAESYAIDVPAARSFVSFKNSGVRVLESQFAPKIVFTHQNIKSPSSYTIEPLTKADGTKNNAKSVIVSLDPANIAQNTVITETVDLRPYLEQVGDEWRGAVRFSAKMAHEFQFYGWGLGGRKLKREKVDTTNEQIIQVTDLAVTARYAYDKAVVLVTSLATGKPVAAAQVSFFFVPHDDLWRGDGNQSVVLTKSYGAVARGKTNADGFADIALPARFAAEYGSAKTLYIEAKTQNDRVVFAPEESRVWRAGVHASGIASIHREQMVTEVFTDRGLYKPGEKITYRIIDRTLYKGAYAVPTGKQAEFKVELTDNAWRNRKVYFSTSGTLSKNGTTWGTITLPADIKPGDYTIRYSRICNDTQSEQTATVQVQFFERLRFEASASIADQTYIRGDTLSADIAASYLGGGVLDNSTYHAAWTRTRTDFVPKNDAFNGFSFAPSDTNGERYFYQETSGTLTADGTANVTQVTGGESLAGVPYRYRMEAEVTDSGNQAIATNASAVVHPAQFYLGVSGIKKQKGFAKKGDKLTFDYVCITPDEDSPAPVALPATKKLTLELLRETWKTHQVVQDNGLVTNDYTREVITESTQTLTLSGKSDKTEISVMPKNGGAYTLRLSTADAQGNAVITERHFYVTSSDWFWHSQNDAQEIGITADKDEYQAGETAQLLVQSALPAGAYLLTVEREGIISQQVLRLTAPTSVVPVPITAAHVPVVYVSLSSYSVRNGKPAVAQSGKDEDAPKSYFGMTTLNVSTKSKRFDLAITTDKATYRAGEKAKITLKATKNGKPLAGAEVTLVAVDRGVLDLIDYHVDDPVDYFYNRALFPDRAAGGDSRNLLIAQEADDDVVLTEDTLMLDAAAPRVMMKAMAANTMAVEESAMASGSDRGAQKIRTNFAATALFLPDLTTDENGMVTAECTLPDSLTAYRITAIGVREDLFAKAEDELLVAEPISVRQVLPRKLRLDDSGEVGVTITNLDDKSHDVKVMLSVYEGTESIGDALGDDEVQRLPGTARVRGADSKRIAVSGKTTVPLMFTIDAQKQGWVTVAFSVQSDVTNERLLLPLEIEKPYIFEAVTTIGEVRGDGAARETERIVLPAHAEDGRGSLYVQLDPTRLGVLREAVQYIFHYPYGCMEQRSAAVLPLVAFGDYITIFGLNSEVKNPAAVAKKEIRSWADAQNRDGGFPYWPNGFFRESNPYVSMRIAEILVLAKQNGVTATSGIDEEALVRYLTNYADELMKTAKKDGSVYGGTLYATAYAYYAAERLSRANGDALHSAAHLEAIAAHDASDVETLALVALTYLARGETARAQMLADKLLTFTRKTTRGIDISEKHGKHYWCFFNADCEKYALFLQLFTRLRTESDVNQRLVYELLNMQKAGRGYWQSTAVTSRILIALHDYITANNLENLDFTAEVLLNGIKLLDGRFTGVAAQAEEADIAFSALAKQPKDTELPLVFSKDGTGTLFYTASMKYAIPPAKQVARDEGLCIYTEITDAKTGARVPADRLIAGNVYRQTVTISSVVDAEYVAVRAPVPAGAEILNTAFVTTGTLAPNPAQADADRKIAPWWYNRNRGLTYKGIYDSEMQFFWDYFPRGSQTVEFQFRATRKGTYHTPCATAECMYEPEIFGRTDGAVWKIE